MPAEPEPFFYYQPIEWLNHDDLMESAVLGASGPLGHGQHPAATGASGHDLCHGQHHAGLGARIVSLDAVLPAISGSFEGKFEISCVHFLCEEPAFTLTIPFALFWHSNPLLLSASLIVSTRFR